MTAKVTIGQLRCLQGLAFGALQMNDLAKETFVERVVPGKRHFRALTSAEAARVIDAMKREAGQTPTRPIAAERRRMRAAAAAGDVAALPTPAQRERLAVLRAELGVAGIAAAYVNGVLERAIGRREPRTSTDAEKAIEALKALAARRRAEPTPEPA